MSPTCPENIHELREEIDRLESDRDTSEDTISEFDDAIAEHLENMACLDNRSRGEKCHFWEILHDVPNVKMLQVKLNDIENRVGDFAENTMNLLMSLLLKTVVIPLLFTYLLLKIMRMNWAKI